ncbi:MAG: Stk1 family PASTA domain-containing Ser/Thr kinase [Clostridia bacterium]|nr:Stk1 family PASTA domain-containing Ser/Thr kinase [Clostridia bacterium]
MNLEGKIIGNRYQIIEKIGNGGMATVYKAKCLVLNRYVAVKILRDEFTTDEEFIKRFNIEAQAAASLIHPNIVSVYDVGNEGNLYYIVMELVKGKTLKEIIIEDGVLGWKWSVKVAMQIASALEMAHKNNIIHRDIKPHNIIITEEGIAKVTDFGIAKAVSNSTITAFGTTIGSVHYFSPEHARGGFTDAKSDLYSLGVVMYEMVTGRVPFDSDTPVSVALKHMQEQPIEPIILKPDLPHSVNDIIIKAMQKDTEKRYSNATQMLKDLEMSLKKPDSKFIFDGIDNREFETQRISLNSDKKQEEKNKNGKFAKMKSFFEKHKILKVLIIILSCILVFSLAMGGTYLALTLGKAKEIQIPDLSNLTLEQAQEKAKELNLKIEVEEEKFHLEIPEGQIIEQNPKYQSNFKIKEETTIKVIVSKGQEIVKMPKVIGIKRDEAMKALKEIGLEVEIKEEYNDEIEKGYITKQETAEGKEIPAGTTIVIYVSMGIEQVQVPDLSGKTESEAKTAMTNAKLKWKSTDKTSDSSKPNGVVVNQTISSGSMVDKNTEITITVNEFDEIKTGTIYVNVKSLLGGKVEYEDEDNTEIRNVNLTIKVGGDTVYNETVSPTSTNIKATKSDKGTKEVTVYIDDIWKATKEFNFNTQTSITIE